MEINFLLAKTEVTENEGIVFQSVYGMPMSGKVMQPATSTVVLGLNASG